MADFPDIRAQWQAEQPAEKRNDGQADHLPKIEGRIVREMPNGDLVSFPGDWSEYKIQSSIRDKFPHNYNADKAAGKSLYASKLGEKVLDGLFDYLDKENRSRPLRDLMTDAVKDHVQKTRNWKADPKDVIKG